MVHIPGYLVWAALLYAGVGTWLTVRVGRPLVQLKFAGQRFEGDSRFSLARLRENAESVASYGGEPVELGVFQERFRNIFANFRMIMGGKCALIRSRKAMPRSRSCFHCWWFCLAIW